MELLTQESFFNEEYFRSYKSDYSFDNLLYFLSGNNYISLYDIDNLKLNLLNSISEYAFDTYSLTEEDDIDFYIRKSSIVISNVLDYKLNQFKTPYEASQYIINTNFNNILNDSIKEYNQGIELIKKIINELSITSSEYRYCFNNYNELLTLLENKYININEGKEIKPIFYTFLNGEFFSNEFNMKLNEAIIVCDRLLKENDIIKKFDINDVKRITKILGNGDNIARAILYTYVFGSLYLEHPERLEITDITYQMIVYELKKELITLDDAKFAIEYGNVKFSTGDLEYITRYFYPNFNSKKEHDILEKCIIKTKRY